MLNSNWSLLNLYISVFASKVTCFMRRWILFLETFCDCSGPGSVVSIETGYRLDGPGIESRWGRDFPHLSRPVLVPTQPPV